MANTMLKGAPVGLELLNGPFDKHLSGTEHIAEFPISGTIVEEPICTTGAEERNRDIAYVGQCIHSMDSDSIA